VYFTAFVQPSLKKIETQFLNETVSRFVCFITTQINVDLSNRFFNLNSFLLIYVWSVPL